MDCAITGGLICDGTGEPAFEGGLRISGDRIADVFHGAGTFSGVRTFDAKGLVLSPGFIDVHSHSDLSLLAAPEAFGKISQGITSEINGNCGLSPFPVNECNRAHLESVWAQYGEKLSWSDLAGYHAELARRRPAINAGSLCGHNTLRAFALGYGDRAAAPDDLAVMQNELARALEQGAFGLSTGLLYVPGKFSSTEELLRLMAELKASDRIYATHLRNEADTLLEALDEALFLAENGSGRLEVSHLKTAFERNWPKLDSVFACLEKARQNGLAVTADRYPYTFGQTNLSIILPPPFDRLPDADIQARLNADPAACENVLRELEKQTFWHGIILTAVPGADGDALAGMYLDEAAAKRGTTPARLTLELVKLDSPGTMAAFGGMSRDNMKRIIAKAYVCCGTDETARPADFSLGRSHPRGFGAFPEFLRLNLDSGEALESAVHRVTGLPAKIFQLNDRGILKRGAFADIVAFDPARLRPGSDFAHPHAVAQGIECVWVNGAEAYRNGRVTARAGRALKA